MAELLCLLGNLRRRASKVNVCWAGSAVGIVVSVLEGRSQERFCLFGVVVSVLTGPKVVDCAPKTDGVCVRTRAYAHDYTQC